MPMQRFQMKALLAEQEKAHPTLFANLLAAMKPLMTLQDAAPREESEAGA